MSELTTKQRLFIEEYLKDFNATKAAQRAGYNGDYWTLAAIGCENLKKPKIAKHISDRVAESAMSADEVLHRLALQARASVTDYIDENGIIDWEAVEEHGYPVKKLSHIKGKASSIELESSQRALELLGKHLSLFTERHDITTKGESLNDGARYNADERTRAISTFLEAIGVASNNEDDTG